MMTHIGSCRTVGAAILLVALMVVPGIAHGTTSDALWLFGYDADTAPSPIDGDITPDGQEGKWQDAYVRSITFASQDGLTTRDGTVLVASDDMYLYVGVGFNSQSSSNSNYAILFFDENHDHVLAGSAGAPGEYYVKLEGSGPSVVENGGYYGSGWQAYSGVFPPGMEAVAQKHGTGSPQTWNFEFKIPLQGGSGVGGESFLNIMAESQIGLLIEVFDASDGILYWEPTDRDPIDPTNWGVIDLGIRGPERELAASITLGHDPVIDGNVSSDPQWQHYTSWKRQVHFSDFDGNSINGTMYAKSNNASVYLGLVLNGTSAAVGDKLNVYLDYDPTTGGDADIRLTSGSENGAAIVYSGVGMGAAEDMHFDNAPGWPLDGIADGEGAVSHNGSDYEFEFRVPLAGTGIEDLQVLLGTLLGLNLEFVDVTSGNSFWWNVATNSRHQKLRVDAASFTALGWTCLQTGAPVIQPVYPKDNDEVSGHYPFMIYTTSATGEAGIVLAEFSYDQGVSWLPLERTDEMGTWTKTWDTTVLPDGVTEVRIRVQDSAGLENRVVLSVVIDNDGGTAADRPAISVTAPPAGGYVSGITNITFSAAPAPLKSIVSTEISFDGGGWMAATSPYVWDTTTLEDGAHIFRVRAVQSDSLIGYSDTRLVMVDNTGPEIEMVSIAYPIGQQAAKNGDVVVISALARDAGSGLSAPSMTLDASALDGTSHTMVDDGTGGDAVAGDNLFTVAVTVSNTGDGPVTVSLSGQDNIGNTTTGIDLTVQLDNTAPAHVGTVTGDADAIYKDTDVVKLTTTWDAPGYMVTADFSAVDNNYVAGAENVVDNDDGTYTVTYAISFENAVADATGLQVVISATDVAGNGPTVYSGYTVELDNTAPVFTSVDTGQDNYRDGDTIVVTAVLDAATYRVWSDFSNIDSNYSAGDETVTQAGNTYTITYTISADATNTTPDGSYDIAVNAEDIAGNVASSSTSIELDNTPEAISIIRPVAGDILSGDVEIDVTSADDTRFIRFQISPDDGANWYNLDGTQTPNDYTEDNNAADGWTQIWRTDQDALPDGGSYRIRVTAYDEMDPVPHIIGVDEVTGGLLVDNTPPSLEIAVAPQPTVTALTGEVYVPEIVLTGSFFDLPDSSRVTSITIEHRNNDGDHINDSPIQMPAVDNTFSRILKLVESRNDIRVTVHDEAGHSFSQSADIVYVIPENATPIGPEGGIVRSPDGTSVIIPAGALQKTVNIMIQTLPGDELPPTKDGQLTLLKRAHHFEPDGLVFHKPVDIILTYTDADLDRDQNGTPDWDEMNLDVYFFEKNEWLLTDKPVIDPVANTLTMSVNHFSTFDIGVKDLSLRSTAKVYWTKNPFKPGDGTACVFEMPEDGTVSLRVYDMSGHLVRKVMNNERITANSSVRWDGLNDFDRFVGSGVYVYIVQFTGDSGAGVTIRKPLGVVK